MGTLVTIAISYGRAHRLTDASAISHITVSAGHNS